MIEICPYTIGKDRDSFEALDAGGARYDCSTIHE